MVVIKASEYQRKFKVSILSDNIQVYLDNFAERNRRRACEKSHTPFDWEGWEKDFDSASSLQINDVKKEEQINKLENKLKTIIIESDTKKEQKIVEHLDEKSTNGTDKIKSKSNAHLTTGEQNEDHKIDNERLVRCPICKKGNGIEKLDIHSCIDNRYELMPDKVFADKNLDVEKLDDSSKAPREIVRDVKRKRRKGRAPAEVHADRHSKTYIMQHGRRRLQRPDRSAPIPKCRPLSAPIEGRPPFVSYGWADVEENLSRHRTHNVRSRADVYPAAVKAGHRHEVELRKHMDALKAKAHRKQELMSLMEKHSSKSVPRESEWMSEYQSHFLKYSPAEYEKSLTARSISARSPSRKLCDVVICD